MDVVLVRADFVGPGPLVKVAGGVEVVEAAVPEDGAGVDACEEAGGEGQELHGGGGMAREEGRMVFSKSNLRGPEVL